MDFLKRILIIAAFLFALPAWADSILGGWTLVQLNEMGSDGKIREIRDAKGSFLFSGDGQVAVQVMYPRSSLKKLLPNGAYSKGGYEASFGTFQVDAEKHVFTIHVNGSLVEKWIGKDLPRSFEIKENRMTVRSLSPTEKWSVVWERKLKFSEEKKMSNLNELAKKNHDEMFPGAKATLRVTDPDFYDAFNNFAFGDALAESIQDSKTRTLLILASTIGSQAITEYKFMASAALNVGASPAEVKEVLYQAVPYVGFSKALDFLRATNEVFQERGIGLPVEAQSTTTPKDRLEKGLAAQKAIFGSGIDKMYDSSPKDLLHIQKFLSANCFGDYYTRKGLDLKMRELVTFSILVALGADPQVKAHIHGNLNMGTTRAELISVITALVPWVGYPRALNAVASLNEISPEKKM